MTDKKISSKLERISFQDDALEKFSVSAIVNLAKTTRYDPFGHGGVYL